MAPIKKPGEICPLQTLEELIGWVEPEVDIDEVVNVAKLSPRSLPRCASDLKTLICHDMKGGYLDDRFYQGCSNKDAYRFYHWSGVDSFVYFSHHLVTIPPPTWINAAHRHGVKILGTFITEWEEGAVICKKILIDEESVSNTVFQLVRVAKYHRFDGWLFNIENCIDPEQVERLIEFVRKLTNAMKEAIVGAEVIWYDSVTREGKLEWQNELNQLNRPFYDVCDGIFLNYTWTANELKRSQEEAGKEGHRVYVGIDVFGRNFYKDGQFNSFQALEIIRANFLSAAIFAPGWTYEVQKDFEGSESRLWGSMMHCLTHRGPGRLPVKTSFCQGFGDCYYVEGKIESRDHWHNLGKQQLQPLWSQEGEGAKMSLVTSDAFNGGGCLGIDVIVPHDLKLLMCGLKWTETLVVSVWYKWKGPVVPFSLILQLQPIAYTDQDVLKDRTIELKCEDGEIKSEDEVHKEEQMSMGLSHLDTNTRIEAIGEEGEMRPLKKLSTSDDSTLVSSFVKNGWTLRTFSVKECMGCQLNQIDARLSEPTNILLGQLSLY